MRAAVSFLLATLFLLASASVLRAATVTATWNANPESDIAGYRLLYGTQSGNYTTTIDVGNVTTRVVTVVGGRTYFFVVQAYDTSGLTGPNSAEVSVNVPAGPAPTLISLGPTVGAIGTPVTITGTEFRRDAGREHGHVQRDDGDADELVGDEHRRPRADGRDDRQRRRHGRRRGEQRRSHSRSRVPPTLTSLSPTSGPVGTSVTITGTNFGATQGAQHGHVQRDGGDADELVGDEHRRCRCRRARRRATSW